MGQSVSHCSVLVWSWNQSTSIHVSPRRCLHDFMSTKRWHFGSDREKWRKNWEQSTVNPLDLPSCVAILMTLRRRGWAPRWLHRLCRAEGRLQHPVKKGRTPLLWREWDHLDACRHKLINVIYNRSDTNNLFHTRARATRTTFTASSGICYTICRPHRHLLAGNEDSPMFVFLLLVQTSLFTLWGNRRHYRPLNRYFSLKRKLPILAGQEML